ncbi:cuticle collagen 2C-like [Macaca nemestrina]|uniref:cuticle collagen 2C-like n=1 Tax=Macaca nemestrina TaxID=9545 RepID=UPI0039B93669
MAVFQDGSLNVKRRGGPDLDLSRQAAQTDLRSQRPLPAGVCASPSRPLAGRVWQSEGPGAAGLGEPGSPSCPLLPGDPRFQGTVLYPGPPSSRAQLLARPPRPAAPVSRPHGGPGASRAPQLRGGCCRAVPQRGPRGPSRATPPPPPAPLPAARLRARRRPATRPLRRLAARLQLSQPRWGLTMLFKLVSKNSWAQAILLPQPPKELGPTTPTDSHGPETEPPWARNTPRISRLMSEAVTLPGLHSGQVAEPGAKRWSTCLYEPTLLPLPLLGPDKRLKLREVKQLA